MRRVLDGGGYLSTVMEPVDALNAIYVPDLLGVFKSKGEATKALWSAVREHGLCARKLNLDKGDGTCSPRQLERCGGVCAALESPAEYNARFLLAFDDAKPQSWPYSGAIVIEEKDDAFGEGEIFVIDHWSCPLWLRYDECGIRRMDGGRGGFDYDHYRILTTYLQGTRAVRVRPITAAELDRIMDRPESVLAPL